MEYKPNEEYLPIPRRPHWAYKNSGMSCVQGQKETERGVARRAMEAHVPHVNGKNNTLQLIL